MKWLRGRWGLLTVIALGLVACQLGPLGQAPPSPRPSAPASAPADPQRCARLAQRGFVPCPPTADQLQLPPTTIRNATNGAVDDATAQRWGRAFQLAQAYYYWAMQNNSREALTSGVLADSHPNAVGNLFGKDLEDLDTVRQSGGLLVFQPLRMTVAQLVTIPVDLQDSMRRQGLSPRQYGFAVKFQGPSSRAVRLPDGTQRLLQSSDGNYVTAGLVWGEVNNDLNLGSIWYQYGAYGCDGAVRGVCQL